MHTEGLEALLELEHLLLHSLPFPGPNRSLPGLALTSLQRPFLPEYWNLPISFSPPDTISNEAHNMLSLFTNYQQPWVWEPPNMALSEPARPSSTHPSQFLSWSQCLPSKLSGSLLRNHILLPFSERKDGARPSSVPYTLALLGRTAAASRGGPEAEVSHRGEILADNWQPTHLSDEETSPEPQSSE